MKTSRFFISALAVASVAMSGCEQMHKQTATFVVDSKESRLVGSGDSRRSVFYVYGVGGEVFRNEDAMVFGDRWKTDSATMQARFKVGQSYRVGTIGWRIPFLSMTPNIISAQPVTNDGFRAPTPKAAGL